jgi:hypothetical protein
MPPMPLRGDLPRHVRYRGQTVVKLLWLFPGLFGFVLYVLGPLMRRLLAPTGGALKADVTAIPEYIDTLALVAGIAASAVCWFYSQSGEAPPRQSHETSHETNHESSPEPGRRRRDASRR